MKWNFDPYFLDNTLLVKVSGPLEPCDVKGLLTEILSSDIWTPTISIAYDCTELDVAFTSIADIRELSTIYAEIREKCKFNRTAIYTDTLIKFGLARQLQIITGLTKGPKIKVFDTWDELSKWVATDPALLPFETSNPDMLTNPAKHDRYLQ